MSIKRSKRPTGGGRRGSDDLPSFITQPKPEPEKDWDKDVAAHADVEFAPYALSAKFDKGALVNHPKFGKGLVVAAEATQITVLFADGKKKLGHNIAPRE